ncbi:MAG: hypothetical protein J6W14_06070, partial [Clostridia bacterium]|nr:hypothetical protein [Clostridia bacterium]
MENMNFWDSEVWSFLMLFTVVLGALLLANLIKKSVPFLKYSLIPTSVLGGILLLIISVIYQTITGELFFNTQLFGGKGMGILEVITYHMLGLGFIATTFRPAGEKLSKKRSAEIFNSGVTTVATYLLQGVLGMGITIVLALVGVKIFEASGLILPFGYGQGTGQALNWGNIYETDYGFSGGRSFGLTIAALGFLSASLGGVVHLSILKRKGRVTVSSEDVIESLNGDDIQSKDEIPMNASIDKMTVQIAIIVAVYAAAYALMAALSALIPSFQAILYGFNFLFGVLGAVVLKQILRGFRHIGLVKKEYVNPFLMSRLGGFFFDVMIVAGIAAIRLDYIKQYWWILLLLGVVGLFSTYFYNRFIAKKLFGEYADEQFLAMYGMLTGTASTGVILLREIDTDFKTPAADNLVYQNLPAIIFGFPLMFLAALAPEKPILTLGILFAFFVVLNVILFRSFIFKRRKGT